MSLVKRRKLWLGVIPVLIAGHVTLGSAAFASGACELSGEGTAASPWLVSSADDFRKVGRLGCTTDAGDHYRQTADFSLENGPNADGSSDSLPGFNSDVFSGVYDGNYYTITLEGAWGEATNKGEQGAFGSYLNGTVQRLKLAGTYVSTSEWSNPLVWQVRDGGVVSEVSSSVDVISQQNGLAYVGGLVGSLLRGSLMEYVSVTGNLEWMPAGTPSNTDRYMGGLAAAAGQANGAQGTTGSRGVEIRDSYSASTMTWPQANRCRVMAGGIIGNTGTVSGDIFVVRTYSSSQPATGEIAVRCTSPVAWNPYGGLFGRVDRSRYFSVSGQTSVIYPVSAFWATDIIPTPESGTVTKTAVGGLEGTPSIAEYFAEYSDRLPIAAGLSSAMLRDITSFQSFGKVGEDIPDGAADLPVASSATISYASDDLYQDKSAEIRLQPQSFRWAIEPNTSPFIASQYGTPVFGFDDGPNSLSRTLYADTTTPRGESRIASAVTGYPALGRVWEICEDANDGFPVLVWEGYCVGDGSAGSSGGGSGSSRSSSTNTADTLGASVDQGQHLAATGVNSTQSIGLALFAGGLVLIGWVMAYARRKRCA